MKIRKQEFQFINEPNYALMLSTVEWAGRTCYKSFGSMTPKEDFIKARIKEGHESILEHGSITLNISTSRSVAQELTRHRLCSFSMESQRYVSYRKEVEFIIPVWYEQAVDDLGIDYYPMRLWKEACEYSEKYYIKLIGYGAKPEEAREVLNNSVATNITVTANIREWRLILKQRTDKRAHPMIRSLMSSILDAFIKKYPIFFIDIKEGIDG